jgi:hypothetical protein
MVTVESLPEQTPLTCIMPIKSEPDYQALAALLPQAKPQIDAAMTAIGTVHFARFVFLSNNTELAIITTFDGDFAKYIGDFATYIGPIFDALFAHITSPPPLPVIKNQAAFVAWVQAHNAVTAGFYSAYPTLKVIDILTQIAPAASRSPVVPNAAGT